MRHKPIRRRPELEALEDRRVPANLIVNTLAAMIVSRSRSGAGVDL